MASLGSVQQQLNSMEELAAKSSRLHKLHPLAKLGVTAVFLCCVTGMSASQPGRLLPFFLYPILVLGEAEIPLRLMTRRAAIALPFCLFGCISNLFFLRQPSIVWQGHTLMTEGMLSTVGILLRALLCVSAVLVLIALTPMQMLTDQLRRLHCPELLVSLVEMTVRYLGLLAQEAATTQSAYRLRGGGGKVAANHMGSLVGQLLIRSMDRAQRVYHAMLCRGYGGAASTTQPPRMTGQDYKFLLGWSLALLLFRLVDIPGLLGGGLLRLL